MLSLIYTTCEYDVIYLAGDVNSRIGSKKDYIQNIHNIPLQKVIDYTSNKHAQQFIDFLLESKMCILNGRICPENDNFTCVRTNGSSIMFIIMKWIDGSSLTM